MRLRVEFEIEIPSAKNISEEKILEWVEFQLIGGVLEPAHPLIHEDFEIDPFSISCEELRDFKKLITQRSHK
ncbi:hypothetical protein C7B80_06115 [Cyanosarcina cf. burmensis CCALA 770]|jgi:hypothetical protein|nr:hypothetical protein C7B80_06115 [Cyanosarcina cf. burmensis CCALA 770]